VTGEQQPEPEGVAYTVRDAEGNVLEIALKNGTRIYIAPPDAPPKPPGGEVEGA
jgi:hypothetical protein